MSNVIKIVVEGAAEVTHVTKAATGATKAAKVTKSADDVAEAVAEKTAKTAAGKSKESVKKAAQRHVPVSRWCWSKTSIYRGVTSKELIRQRNTRTAVVNMQVEQSHILVSNLLSQNLFHNVGCWTERMRGLRQ